MIIRSYRDSDRKAVESICLGTASLDESFNKAMLNVFCDYYLDSEDACRLLICDGKKVLGYILCHPDFSKYEKDIINYLKDRNAGAMSSAVAEGTISGLAGSAETYPAHFHIQIDSSIRGRGYGTSLIRALEEKLIAEGVSGVMLNVASDNVRAQNFYRKNGYVELDRNDCETSMGKILIGRVKQ